MLNVILKTDVLGSLEALLGMLEKIQHELVGVNVIQKGLGNITESDVERADASKPSVVYGFNVQIPTNIISDAREKSVDVKVYSVIYDLFDDVVARLNKLLPQEKIVTELGKAEVAAVFRTEPGKMIVGCRVKEGKLVANAKLRVFRAEEEAEQDIIGEGLIEGLQSGKSSVKEVPAGQECGLSYTGKVKLQEGDILEAYSEELKARKLEAFRI